MSLLVLAVTGCLIATGIGVQIWASGPRGRGRQYALQLPSALLYALASALFLYSIFPDSVSEGRAMGFGLGGAAGFAGFFMLTSYAWLSKTRRHDETEAALKGAEKENARLRKSLQAALATHEAPSQPARSTRRESPIKGDRRHQLGLITGNLADVMGVDVWVNPENTQMEMSRVTEPTVSATIRYHGGVRDAGGHLAVDRIAVELAERMAGQKHVTAGQVLSTGPGELGVSHGVKRIVHVAAVEGEPASGFRQVMDLGRCVRNLLGEVDRLNGTGEALRSVVLPLLGTGGGNSDLERTAEALAAASVGYFQAHPASRIRTVYLLAFTDAQAEVCRAALSMLPELSAPTGG